MSTIGEREIKKSLHWFFGRTVLVVGVVALLAVVVVLLFLLLNWYVAPTKPSERKDLVLAVAQILGGTALLLGLYFTWRTLQVNREGQITERFTQAIDQLGKVEEGQKLFEIRVGGIHALERIARESEEDYWPIMEILTAYVRQNASLTPEEGQEGTEDVTEEESDLEDSGRKLETTKPPALDPDIQAIMTVLQRRTLFYGHGERESLDLHETNLRGADLRGAHLESADLRNPLSSVDEYYGITKKQLEEATGDKYTQLPPDLKPPTHWGVKTKEQPEGERANSLTSQDAVHAKFTGTAQLPYSPGREGPSPGWALIHPRGII